GGPRPGRVRQPRRGAAPTAQPGRQPHEPSDACWQPVWLANDCAPETRRVRTQGRGLRRAAPRPGNAQEGKMRKAVEALGLPSTHLRYVEAKEAAAIAGCAVRHGGWFFGDSGW